MLVLVAPELVVGVRRAVAADEDVRDERGLEGQTRTGDAEELIGKCAPRRRVALLPLAHALVASVVDARRRLGERPDERLEVPRVGENGLVRAAAAPPSVRAREHAVHDIRDALVVELDLRDRGVRRDHVRALDGSTHVDREVARARLAEDPAHVLARRPPDETDLVTIVPHRVGV
ncbi:MAG: hypothetical protein EBZ77_15925 [Chitinophagia bacterium]|nr:hypothetical protein [Chitinophagia bacterium]